MFGKTKVTEEDLEAKRTRVQNMNRPAGPIDDEYTACRP